MSKSEPWWQDNYRISERTLTKVTTILERLVAEHKHSARAATDIMPLGSEMWLKLVVGDPAMAWEEAIALESRKLEAGGGEK